jgi:[ribosomal protein S5]-alanine N-acetyltransferase
VIAAKGLFLRMNLETKNLVLISCDLETVKTVLEGDAAIEKKLGIKVAGCWTEFGDPAFQWSLEKLSADPAAQKWLTYLPVLKDGMLLAGSCGFKGKPDREGSVEIGYEVAEFLRGKGYATEIAMALRNFAFSNPGIEKVIAHTLAGMNASARVLQKCGMIKTAETVDPEDGPVWRWEISLEK